jgi:hypothetical protein
MLTSDYCGQSISACVNQAYNVCHSYQVDVKQIYRRFDIVIEASEYNFNLGLLTLLTGCLPPPVIVKLTYVQSRRKENLNHRTTENIEEQAPSLP